MPVSTISNVTHVLYEVFIKFGGAVTVTIKSTAEGFPDKFTPFEISQAEALPFWGANAVDGKNRWEDLCGLLYDILIARGDISGTVQ